MVPAYTASVVALTYLIMVSTCPTAIHPFVNMAREADQFACCTVQYVVSMQPSPGTAKVHIVARHGA